MAGKRTGCEFERSAKPASGLRTYARTSKSSSVSGGALLERVGNDPLAYVMTATPLLVRDEVLDTNSRQFRELITNIPQRHGAFTIHQGPTRPTLYGIRMEGSTTELTEVFRNGHLEAVTELFGLTDNAPRRLHPWALAEKPLTFAKLARAVTEHAACGNQ